MKGLMLPVGPSRKPRRSGRDQRRILNILRTSTSKLLHQQRKAIETHPREKRQELVARNRHRNLEQQTNTLRQAAGSLNLTTLPIISCGRLATSTLGPYAIQLAKRMR